MPRVNLRVSIQLAYGTRAAFDGLHPRSVPSSESRLFRSLRTRHNNKRETPAQNTQTHAARNQPTRPPHPQTKHKHHQTNHTHKTQPNSTTPHTQHPHNPTQPTPQTPPNKPHQTNKQKRGQGGIEPPTSSTLRRNHATRPLSRRYEKRMKRPYAGW